MSFLQVEFLGFLAVVLTLYWALPSRRAQNGLLLAASYVFYGWLDPRLCLLLGSVTVANYAAGRAIDRFPAWGGRILTAILVLSVANLAWFKYFGWFVEAILPLVAPREVAASMGLWHVALPLGLSFYTFHNLAYTIDVYRGRIRVRTDAVDYLLYGSYFPQLVAGPVERPQNVLPQLESERRFSWSQVESGVTLALWGAFKKLALADTISPFVDLVFAGADPSFGMIWSAALGFTLQALADFSGYTDIARGVSRCFGIELMDNFDHPYLAATPMEFWQRWHMSFSTWLRDYVYLPCCFGLPGQLSPFWTTTRALFVTMMVSGLWHGSTANFLLWGFYYFVIGTVYAAIVAKLPRRLKRDGRWRWLTVPVMFGFTVFGMHLFREPSLSRFAAHLALNPFAGTREQAMVTVAMLGLCAYVAVPLWAGLLWEKKLAPKLAESPAMLPLRTTFWALAAVAVFASVRTSAADFIYFQF
jgi:D-alanyl-lipoteichoic acid acyltransferase DltB (MBOAT superfamily)